ncbi:MAG: GNAT family N-acetyltransferase [Flavobacteriales bacterium]|nr:GNAT family N-acetyltransferase [Flavobacteriales bacterium]
MLKLIKNNDINRDKWDATIRSSLHKNPYGYTFYLDTAFSDWQGLVLNDYAAIVPIISKEKLGFKYLRQPLFCQQLGIYSRTQILKDQLESIGLWLIQNYSYADINWNVDLNSDLVKSERRNNILDLSSDYETLQSQYSKNHLRNIKKFQKSGGTFNIDQQYPIIADLFEKNKGASINTPAKFYSEFLRLASAFNKKNAIQAYKAVIDNELVAGLVTIKIEDFYILMLTASNEKGKKCGAMHALIDYFIRSNCDKSNTLDFEGSDNDNLSRFYKGFGAKDSIYLQIKWNKLPIPLKWIIK